MTLPDAITRLVGCPTFIAMRPTGIMLCLSDRQRVYKIGKRGPHTWEPKFSDLVSIDWQVFSPEQMAQMAAQARQADEQE